MKRMILYFCVTPKLSKASTGSVLDKFKTYSNDDVTKWKHFPLYRPFVRGIHRSPVNSPHKGQQRGALMFSLNCVSINEAGDSRRDRAHYDATVMEGSPWPSCVILCCRTKILLSCHHANMVQSDIIIHILKLCWNGKRFEFWCSTAPASRRFFRAKMVTIGWPVLNSWIPLVRLAEAKLCIYVSIN